MINPVQIRASLQADLPAIEDLYRAAFPGEDLLPLVRELLDHRDDMLSMVAVAGSTIAGHVAFTVCGCEIGEGRVVLLGPLAVAPRLQKRGIGSMLVREGSAMLARDGVSCLCVLGAPAYYGRLGFMPDADVQPPYPLPAAWRSAWQSLRLGPDRAKFVGRLQVPQPWQRPHLWSP